MMHTTVVTTTTTTVVRGGAARVPGRFSRHAITDGKKTTKPRRRMVEVMLSFDTTGSMYSYLTQVRSELQQTLDTLIKEAAEAHVTLRVGVLAHGDYCDKGSTYVVKFLPLLPVTSDNVAKLTKFIKHVGATGGGDAPECYELALNKMRKAAGWSRGSQRAVVLIGDSNPHPVGYTYNGYTNHIDWKNEVERLTKLRVKVYAVHAGGRSTSAAFYKHCAKHTHGAYLPLTSAANVAKLIVAATLKHVGRDAFTRYTKSLAASGSGLTKELETVISAIRTVTVSVTAVAGHGGVSVATVAGHAGVATTTTTGGHAGVATTTVAGHAGGKLLCAHTTSTPDGKLLSAHAASAIDGKMTAVSAPMSGPSARRLLTSGHIKGRKPWRSARAGAGAGAGAGTGVGTATAAPSSRICKFFNSRGGCKNGSHCRFKHVKLCRHFGTPAGCKFGTKCRYAHATAA